jgi:hypothetical protein
VNPPVRARPLVGQPIPRVEDARLLRGRGRFVGDISPVAGIHHAAVVRSPHARVGAVDASAALALDGVLAVVTPDDARRLLRHPAPSPSRRGRCSPTGHPPGLNRGFGGQQLHFTLERLVEMVGRRLGLDPVAVRRRNLIPARCVPYRTPSGGVYDSGDYPALLDALLRDGGHAEMLPRHRRAGVERVVRLLLEPVRTDRRLGDPPRLRRAAGAHLRHRRGDAGGRPRRPRAGRRERPRPRERPPVVGSVCHADPAAEMCALAIALDDSLELRSVRGTREVDVDELLTGQFTTTVAPDELATGLRLRPPEPRALRVEGPCAKPVERALAAAAPAGDLHGSAAALLCTAGILMSLAELWPRRGEVTREEILDCLGGHLCRCTGYVGIVRAAEDAVGVSAPSRA